VSVTTSPAWAASASREKALRACSNGTCVSDVTAMPFVMQIFQGRFMGWRGPLKKSSLIGSSFNGCSLNGSSLMGSFLMEFSLLKLSRAMTSIPPPAYQVFGDAHKKHARKHASFLMPLLAGSLLDAVPGQAPRIDTPIDTPIDAFIRRPNDIVGRGSHLLPKGLQQGFGDPLRDAGDTLASWLKACRC
jgi:hypothetical protein